MDIAVRPLGVRESDEFDQAFTAMNNHMPDASFMVSDQLNVFNRKRVFEFSATHRLPVVYEAEFYVSDGGLMSYGPDACCLKWRT
jgi:putative ABC transport system substrate-binding protein